jgi:hypothetical protein
LTQEKHPWQKTNKQSIPNARRRRRIKVRTRKKPSVPNARRRRRIEVTTFVDNK